FNEYLPNVLSELVFWLADALISLKVTLNPNEVSSDKGNFIVTNAMVNNVKKVSDGHIVYLDHFAKYEKNKVKLDIKKYGHKFNITGTNEFEFDV
ncbi:hypothetical protein, partial [Mycoplasmopsis bovis]|uniref:hypothetical protein n=1 Tax=Mycoplasmopsis bovis TaxID=28903 RepID=UPI003D29468C